MIYEYYILGFLTKFNQNIKLENHLFLVYDVLIMYIDNLDEFSETIKVIFYKMLQFI